MIVLGRIAGPFGVQGWVRVHPFGDDPLNWRKIRQWYLSTDPDAADAEWTPFSLRGCREHGKSLVVAFEGVLDRSGAEAIDGRYVGAPRERLPETEADEYYWGDLIGLAVRNQAGERLGEVSSLLSTGAHDVLEVKDGDTERLIPFVAAYVLSVDLVQRVIEVDWGADW